MTSLGILNTFFNERIRVVDGQYRPVLQRLKSVCERRASGQISEQKALFEVDRILGRKSEAVIPSFIFGQGNKVSPIAGLVGQAKVSKPVNVLTGVRSNYKQAPVLSGVMDFNLHNKREQFPILGLKPLNNDSKNKRFIVSPLARTWFDSKDFKQPVPVVNSFGGVKQGSGGVLGGLNFRSESKSVAGHFKPDVFTHRINESNKAMKAMINNAKQGMGVQPVLGGFSSQANPRHGKRVFPKRQQSVFEMMGGKK
jgi:hypothetical protein